MPDKQVKAGEKLKINLKQTSFQLELLGRFSGHLRSIQIQ
jgi:hypothetical protein